MQSKRILYKNEQDEIVNEIHNLLVDENGSFVLYELEKNTSKVSAIMDMFPRIKKYFTMSNVPALAYPENSKRPYLSIAKMLLRYKYEITARECRIKVDGKTIRSVKYFLKNLTTT